MNKKGINKKTLTAEEVLLNNIEKLRHEIVRKSEPTYLFSVGDSVKIGNLLDCVVSEVLDNGSIYIIDYTGFDNNYGNPILTPHSKRVFPWFEVRKNNNNEQSLVKNKDISIYYSNRSISSLINAAYYFGFDFEPEYQRGLVWVLEDKVSLIDSIFNNVDIGKFTFVRGNTEMDNTEVLDGKQRLTTILEFYEDRFEYKGYKLCR